MDFTNVVFLFLVLPVFLISYYFASVKFKNLVILFFSFLMLLYGAPKLFIYFIIFSLANYLVSYLLYKINKKAIRIVLLTLAICSYFILFHWFTNKDYCFIYFFRDSILKKIYFSVFFFNLFSYLVDVYKNRVEFKKNVLDYLVYVFMFFKFYVGPVVPYYRICGAIEKRDVLLKDVVIGIEKFILGLLKVSIFAYEMGQIKNIFALECEQKLTLISAWFGVAVIFFRYYFYFSGYCDMANGLAKMVGFCFPSEFKNKIFCKSIGEYFRSFHVNTINFLKFYISPWVNYKNKIFKILKYIFIVLLLWYILIKMCDINFIGVFYFGILFFLEMKFFKEKLYKLPKILRQIIIFILILIGVNFCFVKNFSCVFFSMFFLNNAFFDETLTSFIGVFKFFIILFCFFSINSFLKYIQKPREKHQNVIIALKYVFFLVILIFCFSYCLSF